MNAAPLIADLRSIVSGSNILIDEADRCAYSYDNSRQNALPDLVCFADSEDQIQDIVLLCNRFKFPLTVRGRGTNTTGATVPYSGGLVLSLEKMNSLIEINSADRYARVQPGLTNTAVQQALVESKLFWPPDPTSADICTIGGNLAMNAAGPKSLKYGSARDNILGLSAITGQGELIKTGVRTTKGVVGYDLTRLIIGSEGTLAIITEATLKLSPKPDTAATLLATYTSIHHAAEAITGIMNQSQTPSILEFMDEQAIQIVKHEAQSTIDTRTKALLLIAVEGTQEMIPLLLQSVQEAAKNNGLIEIRTAQTQADIQSLWSMRKSLSPALRKIAPNKLNEDIVVPVSQIPSLIYGLEKLSGQFGIPIVNFGHAGNGNIHVNLLYDTQDPEQQKNALPCLNAVFNLVLKLNGSLSGEHGIGFVKREFVSREIDSTTLDLMWRIKQQFDPNRILNPGKVFPEDYRVS